MTSGGYRNTSGPERVPTSSGGLDVVVRAARGCELDAVVLGERCNLGREDRRLVGGELTKPFRPALTDDHDLFCLPEAQKIG